MSGPGLTDQEWAEIWRALMSCRVEDGVPVSLLGHYDELHVRHMVKPVVERIVASRGVSVQADDDLRAAVEHVRALTPMVSDEWPTTGEWLNRADVLDALAASPAPTVVRGVGSDVIGRVRALADEWGWITDDDPTPSRYDMWRQLRAALASSTPEAQSCSCGSPDAYSLNPAEVVVHHRDQPCVITSSATPGDQS